MPRAVNQGASATPLGPLAEGGAASSTASPAKPSVPSAEARRLTPEMMEAYVAWDPAVMPRDALTPSQLGFVRMAFYEGWIAAVEAAELEGAEAECDAIAHAIRALASAIEARSARDSADWLDRRRERGAEGRRPRGARMTQDKGHTLAIVGQFRERLHDLRDSQQDADGNNVTVSLDDLCAVLYLGHEAADTIEQLYEALVPFAAAYEDEGDGADHEDRHNLWEHPAALEITVGDLRRALIVLRKVRGEVVGS